MALSTPPTPPQDPSSISDTRPIAATQSSGGVNLSALQHALHEQSLRIASLEHIKQDNIRLSHELEEARSRIEMLEQHNADLAARRREAVAQFLNMRPLYHDSANAFETRARDIEADDLESMLCVYGSTSMTVANAQQRAIAALNQQVGGHLQPLYYGQQTNYQESGGRGPPSHERTAPTGYAYPSAYMQNGYCRAHLMPYRCRTCGQ